MIVLCCIFFALVLWEVQGECKNYNVLHGHKNAILEAKWLTDTYIVSASADKTVSDATNALSK